MAYEYLDSDKIKVYPTANRSSDARVNDPESYFNSETNITKTLVTGFYDDSFVKADGDNLTIVLKGYRFEVSKANVLALFSNTASAIYACISVSPQSGSLWKQLVAVDSEDVTLDNVGSKFIGLGFTTTEPSSGIYIKVLEEGNVPSSSKLNMSSYLVRDESSNYPISETFTTNDIVCRDDITCGGDITTESGKITAYFGDIEDSLDCGELHASTGISTSSGGVLVSEGDITAASSSLFANKVYTNSLLIGAHSDNASSYITSNGSNTITRKNGSSSYSYTLPSSSGEVVLYPFPKDYEVSRAISYSYIVASSTMKDLMNAIRNKSAEKEVFSLYLIDEENNTYMYTCYYANNSLYFTEFNTTKCYEYQGLSNEVAELRLINDILVLKSSTYVMLINATDTASQDEVKFITSGGVYTVRSFLNNKINNVNATLTEYINGHKEYYNEDFDDGRGYPYNGTQEEQQHGVTRFSSGENCILWFADGNTEDDDGVLGSGQSWLYPVLDEETYYICTPALDTWGKISYSFRGSVVKDNDIYKINITMSTQDFNQEFGNTSSTSRSIRVNIKNLLNKIMDSDTFSSNIDIISAYVEDLRGPKSVKKDTSSRTSIFYNTNQSLSDTILQNSIFVHLADKNGDNDEIYGFILNITCKVSA